MYPHQVARSLITRLAVCYAHCYIKSRRPWSRRLVWVVAELLFPWYTTVFLLVAFWTFGFGVMAINLVQNGLASTWSLGQLLPPFMILLPFQTPVGDVAGASLFSPLLRASVVFMLMGFCGRS